MLQIDGYHGLITIFNYSITYSTHYESNIDVLQIALKENPLEIWVSKNTNASTSTVRDFSKGDLI
jgi:hypothetical protein